MFVGVLRLDAGWMCGGGDADHEGVFLASSYLSAAGPPGTGRATSQVARDVLESLSVQQGAPLEEPLPSGCLSHARKHLDKSSGGVTISLPSRRMGHKLGEDQRFLRATVAAVDQDSLAGSAAMGSGGKVFGARGSSRQTHRSLCLERLEDWILLS